LFAVFKLPVVLLLVAPLRQGTKEPMPVVAWIKPLIVACLSVGVLKVNQPKIDRFLMAFFRDLGRHKARKRANAGNNKSLITTLLRKDNPMEDIMIEQEDESSNLPTYTPAELLEFGNGLGDHPILIGIMGRVYDVSSGERFYGPEGRYSLFAGHDITYALSTGCRTKECVEMPPNGLEGKQILEAKRWLSFFHMHDKYPLVGKLEGNYFQDLLSELVDLSIQQNGGDSKGNIQPPIF
jgi:membrane-associated progesterone receptor component